MHPMPAVDDLLLARKLFVEHEPRDLFYKVATYLVEKAMSKGVPFTLAEAVSVILQTWNRRYYQKGRRFDSDHLEAYRTFDLRECGRSSVVQKQDD